MQVSTLTKIFGLFLCGCIGFLAFALVFSCDISAFFGKDQLINFLKKSNVSYSILLSAIALSLIMLVGSIITGFAQWAIRRPFFYFKELSFFARFLGLTRIIDEYKYWKRIFKTNLKSNQYYIDFKEIDEKYITSIAVALVFRHASREHIRWITTHFATYILSTNFMASSFVLYISVLLKNDILPDIKFISIIPFFVINYFLLVLASFSYYYSYECVFRFSSLIVSEKLLEGTDPHVTISIPAISKII